MSNIIRYRVPSLLHQLHRLSQEWDQLFDPKDIEISMESGILTIKGERVVTKQEENEGYTRAERSKGRFYRRFSLPDTADSNKITAEGKQGVLRVIIPKRDKAPVKKIKVEDKKD